MLNSGTMGTVKSEPAYLIFRSSLCQTPIGSLKHLEAAVKRQAIGSIGGHGFEGQNLNGIGWPDIIFKMGMGRQDLSNNQIGWECFNQAYIEHY